MFKHLIIDGNNFAFRAGSVMFMRNQQGQNVSVIFGLLNMLRSLIDEHQPERACICWDWKGSKIKAEIYPEYKAYRKLRDEQTQMFITDIINQINSLQEVLRFFGIKQIKREGVEADDLIGILVKELPNVLVVSSDRDLFQVVEFGASLFYPPKDSIIDASNFVSIVGVEPNQYLFYRSIVGDPGDQLPGLKGFGDVTTKKLLSKFGTWDEWFLNGEIREEIIDSVNKTQKVMLKSEETKDVLIRNYQLMKLGYLVTDAEKADIMREFNEKKDEFSEEVIKHFFLENQFNSYLARFRTWIHPFRKIADKMRNPDEIKDEMKENGHGIT